MNPAVMPLVRARRNDPVFVYTVQQMLHWFMIGLVFPVMILIILDKGMDIFQAGALIATYSATTIILELPTGGLSDSLGRKRVYLISLGFQALGGFFFLISWSFLSIALATVTLGAARALSSGTIDAWFVDEFKERHPQGNLQASLSKAWVFVPIGIGLGSLIGGLIPSIPALRVERLASFGPYSTNILASELMLIIIFLVTSSLVVEKMVPSRRSGLIAGFKKTPEVLSISIKYGLRNRVISLLLISIAALGIGISSVELLWQPRVADLAGGLQQTWILGVIAAGYFFSSSVGNLLSFRICKLFSHDYSKALTALTLVSAAVLFSLAFQSSLVLFALLYFLLYFSMGVSESPHATIYNNRVPGEVRSTMLSFQSLILQLGGLLGSLTMGFLANAYSIGVAWAGAAAILAFSSLSYLYLWRNGARLGL